MRRDAYSRSGIAEVRSARNHVWRWRLRLAGQYGRNLGGNKALIVSDPGVLAAGWVQQVLASIGDAGLESTLFTRVTPNPRIEEVAAGAVVYAEQGCDIIVAVSVSVIRGKG